MIRDGIDPRTLATKGDGAIWGGLVSTAASWRFRGSTFVDWASTIVEARSNLGHQAKLIHGRRERSKTQFEAQLRKAWEAAEQFLASARPALTSDDFRRQALDLLDKINSANADQWTGEPLDRNLLAYVLNLAAEIGTSTPTVPCRPAAETLGVHWTTIGRALARLVHAGWLDLVEAGQARGPAAARAKASRYRIRYAELTTLLAPAAHIPSPYTGMSSAGPGMSSATDSADRSARPDMSSANQEDTPMITITRMPDGTITATLPPEGGDLAKLAHALAEAGHRVQVTDQATSRGEADATITRLADRRRSSA